uniref:AAA+ ATPase domain-containing protein n=1 Tax=Kalanchoe fedtschenkoi TaxID=63787 RepID=A0A7N0U216_KALFE
MSMLMEFKIVLLYGMGGIGKTTLAKAVYNKLVVHFRRRSFIPSVRETWGQSDGEAILKKTLHNDLRLSLPPNEIGKNIVRPVIDYEEKVLVVLDDVDHVQQIHALTTDRNVLYSGSRLIITSRDKLALSGGVLNESFEVPRLDIQKSLQLFSYHAFGRKGPPEAYMKLSKEIVELAGGLPLALEVFGSFLLDKRRMEEWNDALKKLKQTCPGRLHDILRISYDALDEKEKCIFLDMACFFVNGSMKREDVIDILRGCGFNAEITLTVLVSKSLIKIFDGDKIWMHDDSLRKMGREIVESENLEDPGLRSRLWDPKEVITVIRNNKGTRSIQGIALEFAKKVTSCEDAGAQSRGSTLIEKLKGAFGCKLELESNWDVKSLKPLSSLRLLRIDNIELQGNFTYMPTSIKWLQWRGCPLTNLPSELCFNVLDLANSKVTHLWNGRKSKMAEKLMFLNLSECHHLTSIPDLSEHQNLEKLNLRNCRSLLKLHNSVGELSSLVHLNLEGCVNLMELPTDVSGLKCLESLILINCSRLRELPSDVGYLTTLRELYADGTALDKLPDSIFRLDKLRILSLVDCRLLKRLPEAIGCLTSLEKLALTKTAVEELPNSIGCLVNLKKLELDFCESLTEVPTSIGTLTALESLYFGGQVFTELPSSIGSLSHLKVLSVHRCKRISMLPDSIGGLASLIMLNVEGMSFKELPNQIGCLNMLEQLSMLGCESLERLPESFGNMLNLTRLSLSRATITELPESIGMMERLNTLILEDCQQLKMLPASFGNLKSLCYLTMTNTAVEELREELGMLSSLKVCNMAKLSYSKKPTNSTVSTEVTTEKEQEMPKPVTVPKSFSHLSSLTDLNIQRWKISGKIPDELEQLKSIVTLKLAHNNMSHLPASLRGLRILKYLYLSHCKELKVIPPLPSGLIKLDVSSCTRLESICDLSDMEYLEDLNVAFCIKLRDIPGLQCLKSLKRLFMGGCELCFQAVKSRITKGTLRHLRDLSVPGGEIPSWFVKEVPYFTRTKVTKHRSIKAVVIGVVISLDQQLHDDYRDKLPAIVDIQAKIFRPTDSYPVYTNVLNLMGVPDTNEDQLYLCRYTEVTPLLLMLQEGDRVVIALKDTPRFNGLTLKKFGVHLIYEQDDQIGEGVDEEWLDESERSTSKRLADFLNSL